MLNFGMPPVKIYTASDNQPTEKVNPFISVILNDLFRNKLCLKRQLSYILPLTDIKNIPTINNQHVAQVPVFDPPVLL